MKLRNKKTGETGYLELEKGDDEKYTGLRVYKNDFMYKRYDSLDGVLEEWEDYKPAEPLIKDDKIRKAVRAWAEASYLRGAIFDFDDGTMILRGENHRAYISFDGLDFCEFRHITAEYHTITELCGEEEA